MRLLWNPLSTSCLVVCFDGEYGWIVFFDGTCAGVALMILKLSLKLDVMFMVKFKVLTLKNRSLNVHLDLNRR